MIAAISRPMMSQMASTIPEATAWFGTGWSASLGMVATEVSEGRVVAEFIVQKGHFAPNGFLHGFATGTAADTLCGFGCQHKLPAGAEGFATISAQIEFKRTALVDTKVRCVAEFVKEYVDEGRTYHDWKTEMYNESGALMAIFLCTQRIFYPRPG